VTPFALPFALSDPVRASIGLAISDETPTALAGSVTAANAELLRPYRDLLTRTAATGWLGF
jgi:hypothetical protein